MNETEQFLGKRLLIGLTYRDHKKVVTSQVQIHGTIVRCDNNGIHILLTDGKGEFALPPDLKSLQKAPPGEYRLRLTGEVVVNPDFHTSWIITAPKPGRKKGT